MTAWMLDVRFAVRPKSRLRTSIPVWCSDSAENPDLPWSDNDLPVPLSASDYDEGIFDESSVVWPLLCKAFYSTPLLSFGDAIREDMKLAFGSARLSVAELGAFLRLTRVEADRQLVIFRRLALDGDFFSECVACRFPTVFDLDHKSADRRRKRYVRLALAACYAKQFSFIGLRRQLMSSCAFNCARAQDLQ